MLTSTVSAVDNSRFGFDYKIVRTKKSDGVRSSSTSNATVVATIESECVVLKHERVFDGCESIHSARRMMSFEMLDWTKKFKLALSSKYLFASNITMKGCESDLACHVHFASIDGHMGACTVHVRGCATLQAAEDAAVASLTGVLQQAEAYFSAVK